LTGQRLYTRDFAAVFASHIGFVLANMLLAHYARWIGFLGGDERDIGLVMGVAPIVSLLFRPWLGPCIDRLGVRTTWIIGETILLTAVLANLLASGVGPYLYVVRTLMTFGVAIIFASSLTYITHLAPPSRQAEAIGVFGAGGFSGMIVGPMIGDWILGGLDRSYGNFVVYFTVVALAIVSSAAMLLFVRPVPIKGAPTRIKLHDFTHTARQHWPGAILLVNILFGVCMTVPFVFLSRYLDYAEIVSPGMTTFFLVYGSLGLTLRLSLRKLPAHIGRRKVLLTGLTVLCCGSLSFLLVDAAHPWWLLAPAVLLGTGHALTFHTLASLSLDSFPAPVRGTGSVLALMHIDLGLIAGGPLLGQIAYRFGYSWLFIVAAMCALSASILYAWSSIPVWKSRRLARLVSADAGRTCSAPLATPAKKEPESWIMERPTRPTTPLEERRR
jgi:MFS family permease